MTTSEVAPAISEVPLEAVAGAVRATVWIDTNVMLEIFTFGDFFFDLLRGAAAEKIAKREARVLDDVHAAAKRRRVRAKHSLWMAMALCREGTATISYHHEVSRNALRIAPPDTKLALPTKALFNALMPNGLFDGWTILQTTAGANLSNKARDRLMVDTCRDKNLRFISRDAGALEYARTQGVVGVSPEDYAAQILAIAEARAMFLARLDRAALLATFEHVGYSLDPGWLTFYLRQAIERYEGVWEWCWERGETR
jgi:hypothetical protein